jgi:hypothetical protein
MSTLSKNPLSKHFRQPILYVKLPSQGRWYPDNSIDIPVTGDVPIYAMTAKDEITMKTPDALMNGTSTVHVIESCCPAIKDPWKMPTVDLDTLLISIRIATYGKEMDFTTVCPHCENKNEHAIDLEYMMSKIAPADWSKTVKVDELEIMLKPQSYEDYNKNNLINFDEQRILSVVSDTEMSDEEKTKKYDALFQKLISTSIDQVSKSIAGIKMGDGTIVDNAGFIKEFLDNCDRSVWEAIRIRLDEIKMANNWNDVALTCENETCGKEYHTPFVFEQTNFFG